MSLPAGARIRALYGSETGNAEQVAHDLVDAARARGLDIELTEANDVTPGDLVPGGDATVVLLVTATTGDGDMPYNAERFWKAFSDTAAPRLDGLPFAVLGLGDTGYFEFCRAAELFDARFEELGATRLLPLRKLDYEYEDDAAAWTTEIVALLASAGSDAQSEAGSDADFAARADADADFEFASADAVTNAGTSTEPTARTGSKPGWSRNRPYRATVLHSRWLSGKGALKAVRHVQLSVGSGAERLDYQPGDSVGIIPSNDPALVDAVLDHLGVPGTHEVDGRALADALTSSYEISRPSRELVEEIGRRTTDPDLTDLLTGGDRKALHEYLWARDVLDLLRLADRGPLTPAELLGVLSPLAHRSYSISSSPLVAPGKVDLAVATLRYQAGGRERGGVCSTHLADRLGEGDEASVFLVPNDTFRIPADDDAPMIMVGPGTGVAPFRAFLHERRARGANGRNWLFFGARHRRCDMLYGDELDAMTGDGLLTRLDLAFSRDGTRKVYVQDLMRAQGKELFGWLADGAYLYVCGDAVNMAGDVDRALHELVAEHGGLSADAAAEHVDELRRTRRYVRDVY